MKPLARFIAVCAASLLAAAAHPQSFPEKPITVLAAFPAGAGADASLRALAAAAGRHLGQQVLVDNRPGVAGTLAATALMNARPDGYTLAQVTNTLVRQSFITRTNYDVTRDFSYVIGVTAFEFGLAVRADAPWKTLDEFLAHAKAHPGVTYGTSGVGTAQHQVMERLAEARGIRWTHVPYKGTAPLLTDLQGGHLGAVSDTSGWAPLVDAGKFRLLAVYGSQRLKRWPLVPTLKESGFDMAESVPWGLVAPAGTSPAVVRRLHDAFRKAMDDPQFLATLEVLGQEQRYMGSEAYRKYMLERIPVERAVVERYNLRLQ
ncbi:MAG TPA: tripartite tricarboxylate transporter substrate binding protein [Ramlibacter sp.]|nr:tripartite tricarboxylate transporter substrate binding protein [Ramlibacter sp.]